VAPFSYAGPLTTEQAELRIERARVLARLAAGQPLTKSEAFVLGFLFLI
jgi:hypothetical protein